MDLIYANEDLKDIEIIQDYSLDLAYGSDENDFELQVDEANAHYKEHNYIYIEKSDKGIIQGTEYGGIIDKKSIDTDKNTVTYYGRTWHGILNSKVIEPPQNTDYLIVNGDANDVIKEIINSNRNKNIAIVSHGTAISTMLKTWCDVKLNEDTKLIEIYYDHKMVFDGNWNCPELFKLVFDENDSLISIMNIRS